MRRTVAVVGTSVALAAGALVVGPSPSSAATAPTLVSVTASPKSVTTVGKLNAAKKVTVTAVYNDPDDVLRMVEFGSGTVPRKGWSSNTKDFSATKSGSRRTFSWTFAEDYNSTPGIRKAYVQGEINYGDFVAGTAGSTSYTVKNQPLLSIRGSRGLSYIWGKKARLVGNLTSTPANANKKLTIQFDKKGKQKGKQWKTRQTVTTDASGRFQTKKFKISTAGTWRAVYAGSTYVLSAKGTFKVKKP